jgi:hypothetical protein
MKAYVIFIFSVIGFVLSCKSKNINNEFKSNNKSLESDTIRIANEDLEYEIIIIDPEFSSWIRTYAKPRKFYSQSYLETRNRIWVQEWNQRVNFPSEYSNLYELPINYDNKTNYGHEVNYLLYNYLVYFQLKNNQKLGIYPAKR